MPESSLNAENVAAAVDESELVHFDIAVATYVIMVGAAAVFLDERMNAYLTRDVSAPVGRNVFVTAVVTAGGLLLWLQLLLRCCCRC